jgi:hypothetical protein
LHKFNHV